MMYTNKRLTFVSDLLPALGGVAAEFLQRSEPGESYCAGLWKNNLIQHLNWTTNDDVTPAKKYQAPSWSWASVCGSVDYPNWNTFDLSTCKFIARVIDVSIDLTSSNPFGEVNGGFAMLEGPVFSCVLTHNPYVTKGLGFEIRNLGIHYNEKFEPGVDLQISEFQDDGAEGFRSARRVHGDSESASIEGDIQCTVFALHLYDSRYSGGMLMILGVVEVSGEEPLFERLGLLKISSTSWVYEDNSGEKLDRVKRILNVIFVREKDRQREKLEAYSKNDGVW